MIVNYYPVEATRKSNMRHRPIGIGVQGLADAFILMRYPFESDEAKQLNKEIHETIYYAAMTSASKDLAKVDGAYETYEGSPLSQGIFQFDMWGVTPSSRWEWDVLREEVKKFGARNSLLLAPMPTASTSQILGNNQCFKPYTSNIYTRRVLSGEFPIVNKHLLKDLVKLGMWNDNMKNQIIAANGSVQGIEEIPQELKEIYKTVWEIKQRNLIDMAGIPRCIHMPKPVIEHVHRQSEFRQAHQHAFLCLERIENRYVLPAQQECGRCHQVYC